MMPFTRLPVVSAQTAGGMGLGGMGLGGMGVAVGAGIDASVAVPVAKTGVFKGENSRDGAHPDRSSMLTSSKQAKRRKFDDIGQSLIIFI